MEEMKRRREASLNEGIKKALPLVSLSLAVPPISDGFPGAYDLETFEVGKTFLPARKSFLHNPTGGSIMAQKRWRRGTNFASDLGE